MIDAVLERDFPVVQALALIFGILVVLVNLVADLARAALDPRIKLA
jgi:peptide/nickel transport system permease protein